MVKEKPQNQDTNQAETGTAIIPAVNDLKKPEQDTKFAHNSAVFLKDIITQNHWAMRLGGQSEHIQYEGWQTAGKYYGYLVKTGETEYIELGGSFGFKAKATVINERTGITVGGAEAYCMNDEKNWSNKPKFQLASMAQTRAGSKALRQILGFVVALAGYNPTPAEEMEGVYQAPSASPKPVQAGGYAPNKPLIQRAADKMSLPQETLINDMLNKRGKTQEDLRAFVQANFGLDDYRKMTKAQASQTIDALKKLGFGKPPAKAAPSTLPQAKESLSAGDEENLSDDEMDVINQKI